METKGKEGKRIQIERDRGRERERRGGKKKANFPAGMAQKHPTLCLMDTLTVKDTVKQGEGQLKFSFKFCYLKCLGLEVRLNSLIWKSFRALLPQGNEMWLTVVYELEPRCCRLLVRIKFKPQIVGGAGKGQTLHRRACVRAKERGCTVFTIVHLIRHREEHDGEFCCLWRIKHPQWSRTIILRIKY